MTWLYASINQVSTQFSFFQSLALTHTHHSFISWRNSPSWMCSALLSEGFANPAVVTGKQQLSMVSRLSQTSFLLNNSGCLWANSLARPKNLALFEEGIHVVNHLVLKTVNSTYVINIAKVQTLLPICGHGQFVPCAISLGPFWMIIRRQGN